MIARRRRKGRQRFPIGTESAGLERTLESRGYQRAEFIAPSPHPPGTGGGTALAISAPLSLKPCETSNASFVRCRRRRRDLLSKKKSIEPIRVRFYSRACFQQAGFHYLRLLLSIPFVLKTRATTQVRDPLCLLYARYPSPFHPLPLPPTAPSATGFFAGGSKYSPLGVPPISSNKKSIFVNIPRKINFTVLINAV